EAGSQAGGVSAGLPAVVQRERRSSLPHDMGRCILAGFDKHTRVFRGAPRQAKSLFERAAWSEARSLSRERIQMYDRRVQEAVERLVEEFPQAAPHESRWPANK